MGLYYLTDCQLFVAEYDMTTDHNKLEVSHEINDLDTTTFGGGGYHSRIAGLADVSAKFEGITQIGATSNEGLNFAGLNTERLVTVAHTTGADGERADIFKAVEFSLGNPAKVGELATFTADFKGTTTAVRTAKMLQPKATKTSSSTGTITLLGAVSATQKLYAALHVFSVAGSSTPTLTAKIQSAAGVGFGSPTDRFTFTAATAATSQWATPVSGAITDTYWRVSYTISGTTPSFSFAIAVGIQ